MNKLIFFILIATTLTCNFIYAETLKSVSKNETISDEEFMKQYEQLEQRKKEAKNKTAKTELQLKKSKEELEASKKLGKTLDEILDKVEKIK